MESVYSFISTLCLYAVAGIVLGYVIVLVDRYLMYRHVPESLKSRLHKLEELSKRAVEQDVGRALQYLVSSAWDACRDKEFVGKVNFLLYDKMLDEVYTETSTYNRVAEKLRDGEPLDATDVARRPASVIIAIDVARSRFAYHDSWYLKGKGSDLPDDDDGKPPNSLI